MEYGTIISGSVGSGGKNTAEDVRLVQRLLNDARVRNGLERLKVDGVAGRLTCAAILQYQNSNGLTADSRIDPGGRTLKHLMDAHLASLKAGLITPYMTRGALDAVPKVDKDTATSIIQNYIASLKS
jgi:peptidoglycan hydrolase-like protein with peptidoglycan-binding domain